MCLIKKCLLETQNQHGDQVRQFYLMTMTIFYSLIPNNRLYVIVLKKNIKILLYKDQFFSIVCKIMRCQKNQRFGPKAILTVKNV